MESSQVRLTIPDGLDRAALCGVGDANLRAVEELFDATVALRSDQIVVTGSASDISVIASLLSELIAMVESGAFPSVEDVRRCAEVLGNSDFSPSFLREDTLLTYRGRAIRPKTSGQKQYCDAIRANTVTFGIGPAGTGKTYLAMAMAIAALKRKEIGRIVLTRPVVEAGENLGFLPGTLTEKVDPYVRPLYDALFDMTDMEKGNQLLEQGVIEIAPLAFMRGRTFNDAFLILDEAQNTTPEQMKMFLTRLGFGSKMVITG
ncbi:MAG: PhoH family protein, partial [Coriobacteriaceae bacterium]|nr:PhoH family protein [Coriobacteriaceae bacterium]